MKLIQDDDYYNLTTLFTNYFIWMCYSVWPTDGMMK